MTVSFILGRRREAFMYKAVFKIFLTFQYLNAVCLLMVLILSSLCFVIAQEKINPKNYKQTEYISLLTQNDLYQYVLQADKYFTNGLHIEYASHLFNNKVGRAVLVGNKNFFNEYSLSFGQDMHTPADISNSEVDSTDRPYAGLLYFTHTRVSSDPNKGRKLTSRTFFGVIGPLAMAEPFQKFVHENISNSQNPEGWDHQIANGLILDYEVEMQRLLPVSSNKFEVNIKALGHVGTIYNYFQVGIGAKIGLFNYSYLNFDGKYNKSYKSNSKFETEDLRWSRKKKEKLPESDKKKIFNLNRNYQVYIFFNLNAGYLLYDGTLQGSLISFSESVYVYEQDRIDHDYNNFNYGIVLSYKYFEIQYERVSKKDIFSGEGIFGWGQIRLIYSL